MAENERVKLRDESINVADDRQRDDSMEPKSPAKKASSNEETDESATNNVAVATDPVVDVLDLPSTPPIRESATDLSFVSALSETCADADGDDTSTTADDPVGVERTEATPAAASSPVYEMKQASMETKDQIDGGKLSSVKATSDDDDNTESLKTDETAKPAPCPGNDQQKVVVVDLTDEEPKKADLSETNQTVIVSTSLSGSCGGATTLSQEHSPPNRTEYAKCAISVDEAQKLKSKAPAPPALPAKPARFRPGVGTNNVSNGSNAATPSSSPEVSVRKTIAVDHVAAASPPAPSPPPKPSPASVDQQQQQLNKPDTASPSSISSEKTEKKDEKSPGLARKQFMHTKQLISGLFRNRDKSPAKGAAGKLSTQKATDVRIDESTTNGMENNNSGSCLPHLTAQRPRNPNKRPPSQFFLNQMSSTESDSSPTAVVNTQPATHTIPQKVAPLLPNKPLRPPPPGVRRHVDSASLPHQEQAGDKFVSKDEFDKLKAEFEEFRRVSMKRIEELESHVPPAVVDSASRS